MDESIKEQSKKSVVEPYNAKDFKSDWERAKRQAAQFPMPVPQLDSDAAKGNKSGTLELQDVIGQVLKEATKTYIYF